MIFNKILDILILECMNVIVEIYSLYLIFFRLVFSRTQHHVTAQVFSSCSPVPVLSCSTKEWAIKQELASMTCVAACQAVGDVLAIRCRQAGITRMVYRAIPWTYRSDAVRTWNIFTICFLFFLSYRNTCVTLFSFTGSVFQGSNERRRNHPQWTQKKICWDLILGVCPLVPFICSELYLYWS